MYRTSIKYTRFPRLPRLRIVIKVFEAEAEAEAEAIGWKRKRLKIVRFRIPV